MSEHRQITPVRIFHLRPNLAGVYRSAYSLSPAHGTRGHACVIVEPAVEALGGLFADLDRGRPALWRCLGCHAFTFSPAELCTEWCRASAAAIGTGRP